MGENYFLASVKEMVALAKLLEPLDLTLDDRLTFCTAPVSVTDSACVASLLAFASDYLELVSHAPP